MTALARPTTYAAALSLLWAGLSWNAPTTTYHIAPLLVAAAVPGALLLRPEPPSPGALLAAIATGAALAVGTTGSLAVLGWLQGPSLLPFGGAVTESLLFAGIGAAAAGVIGTTGRRSRS